MHRFLGGGHRYRSYITVVTDVTDAALAKRARRPDLQLLRLLYVYYEVDDDEVPSALSLDEYTTPRARVAGCCGTAGGGRGGGGVDV